MATQRGHVADSLLELVGNVMGSLEIEEFRGVLLLALLAAVPAKWASLQELAGPRVLAAIARPRREPSWTGTRHEVGFRLPSEAGRELAVGLLRDDRDFTKGERDLLNRARPFLIQAYRNALAYSTAAPSSPEVMDPALIAAGLTAREAEVMRRVAQGSSNRDVARQLGLSDRTVQKHLEHVFRKLAVTTRSAASARTWELARAAA